MNILRIAIVDITCFSFLRNKHVPSVPKCSQICIIILGYVIPNPDILLLVKLMFEMLTVRAHQYLSVSYWLMGTTCWFVLQSNVDKLCNGFTWQNVFSVIKMTSDMTCLVYSASDFICHHLPNVIDIIVLSLWRLEKKHPLFIHINCIACQAALMYFIALLLRMPNTIRQSEPKSCLFTSVVHWGCTKSRLTKIISFVTIIFPSLVPITARGRPGNKPYSKPLMSWLLTHNCVTRAW